MASGAPAAGSLVSLRLMASPVMDRQRFLGLWSRLGAADTGSVTFGRLDAAYGEPHRVYHTGEHIMDCLEQLDEASPRPADRALEAAIWFHDAVYDPHREDNEAASAALAGELLEQSGVADSVIVEVDRLIRLTRDHDPSPDIAGRLICDVDLSILGRTSEEFAEFERRIRAEYAWVPEAQFREGRARVLARFLARPFLYQTAHFLARYEAAARENLRAALARLGA